ncbi:MAG: hypothetical protein Q4A31_07550 [Corynebacterium sp.]|uniref:hypothetical protein n=1 Tax=Corynebacterium sp. TaxID=1720 RepID=UPI0026DB0AED|nr:hypothetical protein [Corynebacterium sp.]MDO4761757.1 hypothetical protein [Corynebacterium sp.]
MVSEVGRGLRFTHLLLVAGVCALFHAASVGVEKLCVPDVANANFSQLTWVVLLELLSWAGLPIIAWLYAVALRRAHLHPRLFAATVAYALICEFAFDIGVRGALVDFSAQSVIWALPLCFIVAATYQYAAKFPPAQRMLVTGAVIFAALAWIVIFAIGLRVSVMLTGAVVLVMFCVFYFVNGRENTMMLSAGMIGASFLITPAIGVVFLHYRAPLLEEKGTWPNPLWLALYPVLLLSLALI